MADQIEQDATGDTIDRRGFLKCMAWVGAGVVWSLSSGGVLTSRAFGSTARGCGLRLCSGRKLNGGRNGFASTLAMKIAVMTVANTPSAKYVRRTCRQRRPRGS